MWLPLGHNLSGPASNRAPLSVLARLIRAHGKAVVNVTGNAHEVGIIRQGAWGLSRSDSGGTNDLSGHVAVVVLPPGISLVCVTVAAVDVACKSGLGREEKRGRADDGLKRSCELHGCGVFG